MTSSASFSIAKWLEQENVIPKERTNLFAYAAFSLIFGLLPFFLATVFGLLFGMLREALMMITPFFLIRKFSGGYHASSPKWCIIYSSIIIIGSLGIIKGIILLGSYFVPTMIVIMSVICIFHHSPIVSPARKLTDKECKVFGLFAKIIATVCLLTYIALLHFTTLGVASSVGFGIVVAATLQCFALLQKHFYASK